MKFKLLNDNTGTDKKIQNIMNFKLNNIFRKYSW